MKWVISFLACCFSLFFGYALAEDEMEEFSEFEEISSYRARYNNIIEVNHRQYPSRGRVCEPRDDSARRAKFERGI